MRIDLGSGSHINQCHFHLKKIDSHIRFALLSQYNLLFPWKPMPADRLQDYWHNSVGHTFLPAAFSVAHKGLAFVSREIKASLNYVKLQVLCSPAIHNLSWMILLRFAENREKEGMRGNHGVIYCSNLVQDFTLT